MSKSFGEILFMRSLHVILRHPQNQQHWDNDWESDDLIKSINTTPEIGKYCEEAKANGARVFVHRCAFGDVDACICCSAKIKDVSPIVGGRRMVTFTDVKLVGRAPSVVPSRGQNFYWAEVKE